MRPGMNKAQLADVRFKNLWLLILETDFFSILDNNEAFQDIGGEGEGNTDLFHLHGKNERQQTWAEKWY